MLWSLKIWDRGSMSYLALRRVFWAVLASVLIIGFAPVGIRFDSISNCLGPRDGGNSFERIGVAESTNLEIENFDQWNGFSLKLQFVLARSVFRKIDSRQPIEPRITYYSTLLINARRISRR
jgi:hypothetical protein